MISFLFQILGKPSTHFVIGFLVFHKRFSFILSLLKVVLALHDRKFTDFGLLCFHINMVTYCSFSPIILGCAEALFIEPTSLINGRLFEVCLCRCCFASATLLTKRLSNVQNYHSLYL